MIQASRWRIDGFWARTYECVTINEMPSYTQVKMCVYMTGQLEEVGPRIEAQLPSKHP